MQQAVFPATGFVCKGQRNPHFRCTNAFTVKNALSIAYLEFEYTRPNFPHDNQFFQPPSVIVGSMKRYCHLLLGSSLEIRGNSLPLRAVPAFIFASGILPPACIHLPSLEIVPLIVIENPFHFLLPRLHK